MTALRVVISGAGAAGVACANLLQARGISDITVLDSQGILHRDRADMNGVKAELAARTNRHDRTGGMVEALEGADVFLGVSGGVVPEELIATMAPKCIVFALSNPDPEVHPDAAAKHASIVATGRSDFPEPDQQCVGLSRSFPRCAGCRCQQDQRRDENGCGRSDLLHRRR